MTHTNNQNPEISHFYSTQECTRSDLDDILRISKELKKKNQQTLSGHTISLLFFNPSLRTRTSFITGMFELGGQAIVLDVGGGIYNLTFSSGEPMLGQAAEHVKEAANVLARYGSAIAIRKNDLGTVSDTPESSDWATAKKDQMLKEFMKYSTVPIINMESNLYHPCQALADIMTIQDNYNNVSGKKFLLTWAYHPKALPTAVPNSAALIASRYGMNVTLLRPEGYDLDPQIVEMIESNAEQNGQQFEITDDIENAYSGAHIVYAKSWGNLNYYGNWSQEKTLREKYKSWQVTPTLMDQTNKALFMHCLPVRRNVVVADEVIDGPASIVYKQAENRLHTQKGLLTQLITNAKDFEKRMENIK